MLKKLLLPVLLFCFSGLRAQVPVHEEPFHVPVFQNGAIRVLNVQIPPGDTSLYHLHHTPSLFIFLSSTATSSQLWGKSPTSSRLTAGRLLYENLAAPNNRIHRVWNIDPDTLHVIDVELLSPDSGFARAPLQIKGLTLEVDTPFVRAYRLTLKKGETFTLKDPHQPLLLVSLEAGSLKIRKEKKWQLQEFRRGGFLEIEKGKSFSVIGADDSAGRYVIVEWGGY